MGNSEWPLIVFSKPWQTKTLPELAKFLKGMGLSGVELPVRPGYQVEPDNIAKGLPEAVKIFADHGMKIGSVAGNTDEATIAACGEAGVPLIRTMMRVGPDESYLAAEVSLWRSLDGLLPLLEKHGVAVGLQNHCNAFAGSAISIRRLAPASGS